MAATSSTNAWAVGYDRSGAFIEHWNGRAWKVKASPKLGFSHLLGVAATSSRNALAVGYYDNLAGTQAQTLIEHWDGRAWKVQASPSPLFFQYQGIQLSGVAATSSTNAWAVGCSDYWISSETEETHTLIEHWNGRAWKVQASPNEGGDFIMTNQLFGVAATSSTNAWAVGEPIDGDEIEHWNGSAWTAQPSPGGYSQLFGVAATSSRNVWAVGYYYPGSGGEAKTLALHYG